MRKTVITPQSSSLFSKLAEVWEYRELLWVLSIKDIKVKYAQTLIGLLWAILNPLLTLILLSFVFGIVADVDAGEIPHVLFTVVGLCGWTYFSALISEAGNSIVNNQNMIHKVYFPRLILPLSKTLTCFLDLLINLFLVFIFMMIFDYWPSLNIIYLPIFIIMAVVIGLAGGIWISALTVRYRDFRFVTQFILRLSLYASPVAYASSAVPDIYKFWFNLNPLVGIIEGFRWSCLGTSFYRDGVYLSIAISIFLLLSGVYYFNKVEKIMADII